MLVHCIADDPAVLPKMRSILEDRFDVSLELLADGSSKSNSADAVIVTVDLRSVENISAAKKMSTRIRNAKRRIFLVDQNARLCVMQAYALGATHVLSNRSNAKALLAHLIDCESEQELSARSNTQQTAAAGVATYTSMFADVGNGNPVDVSGAVTVASWIAETVAKDGISNWLDTVRWHHEGTYQHCLLVTGLATDFGLSLGMTGTDIQRLYTAAMFHDIGKARIPLAVLDKPGQLDSVERALVETHPVAGYEALKGTGVSNEVLDAVRHHHEFLDGSGYPDNLTAADISDVVRMLTISDIFAALIEQRSYKPTRPRSEAYEILLSMRSKLDPALVSAFKKVAIIR